MQRCSEQHSHSRTLLFGSEKTLLHTWQVHTSLAGDKALFGPRFFVVCDRNKFFMLKFYGLIILCILFIESCVARLEY